MREVIALYFEYFRTSIGMGYQAPKLLTFREVPVGHHPQVSWKCLSLPKRFFTIVSCLQYMLSSSEVRNILVPVDCLECISW